MSTETPQRYSERLKALTETELRDRWRQMDYGMWETENETDPERSGNNWLRNPADEYMYDDMSHEADLINMELKRRGLAPCERALTEDKDDDGDIWPDYDEEEEEG